MLKPFLVLAAVVAFSGRAQAQTVEAPRAAVAAEPAAAVPAALPAGTLQLAALPATSLSLPKGPAQVILIRHGEKPASGNDLSPRGYQRAQALVAFFTSGAPTARYGPPAAIYAEQPQPDGSQARPFETVKPLADSLGQTVDTDFKKKDAAGLAQDILTNPDYAGKMVLISWEHHMLPDILRALGWTTGPDAYPDAAFDRVWTLDFDGGKPVAFSDTPQRLLPGDSDK
ncbi:MAG: histidine phosphatase family protein [Elusimicrobia bacterium]|nr:histidine phosphatase family protein [Elusimicrobiota bacterium]